MAKFFGEYLVEKSLISQEVLLQALLTQIKELPSVPQVVFDNQLLSTDKMMEVFKHQSELKGGFIEAARALGLWTPTIGEFIESHLAKTKIPLGEILVKMGVLKLEQISKALDEFLEHVKHPPKPVLAPHALPSSVEVEKVKGVPSFDLSVFCEAFSLESIERAKLGFLGSGGQIEGENLAYWRNWIHQLRGAASLLELSEVGRLLKIVEDVLLNFEKRADPEATNKIKNGWPELVQFLWVYQENLNVKQSESVVLADPSSLKTYENVVATWELLKFDLGLELAA